MLNFVVEDVLEHLLKYFSLPCMSQNLTVFTGLTGLTRFTAVLLSRPSKDGFARLDGRLGKIARLTPVFL